MRPEDYRPPSGIPARGCKWANATVGNEIALKHGAYAPRRVDPLARKLVETVADVAYLQDDPSYRTSLWAWGRAEARVQLVSERELLVEVTEFAQPAPCRSNASHGRTSGRVASRHCPVEVDEVVTSIVRPCGHLGRRRQQDRASTHERVDEPTPKLRSGPRDEVQLVGLAAGPLDNRPQLRVWTESETLLSPFERQCRHGTSPSSP